MQEKLDDRVDFRINRKAKEHAQAVAHLQGRSLGQIIRILLNRYLQDLQPPMRRHQLKSEDFKKQ